MRSLSSGARRGLRISDLLVHHRLALFGLVALSLLAGIAEAAFLVLATNTAFAVADGDAVAGLPTGTELTVQQSLIVMTLCVILRVALGVWSGWTGSALVASVTAALRIRLADGYFASTWASQHGARTGRLQDLLTTFADRGSALVTSFAQTLMFGANLIALLTVAAVVDWKAAIAVAIASAILALALRPIRNAVRGRAKLASQSGLAYATSLSEVSTISLETHVFGVETLVKQRIVDLVARHQATSRGLDFARGVVPTVYTGLAFLAITAALAFVAGAEGIKLSSLGAVMLLMLRSLSYGQAMQSAVANTQAGLPFLDVLGEELHRFEAEAVVDGGVEFGRIEQIQLVDVSFEYIPGIPALNCLSASINASEVIGVVGPSGSGKSTLVQLLLGLRTPTGGRILIDGRDSGALSKRSWVRRVTLVPQDAHLIAGTVAENIRFFRDDVTQEQIEHASRLANLHDDIAGFADGYDRQVGEQGSHLSGGQQQRLIIARALVEKPDVLILDEPTSALDVRSEHLIRQTLNTLREKMTIIIVAHRLSTLEICDRIMVIQDGELKGLDTPENLEKTNDFYREALILSGMR
jgi:ABC-type multidrug transport system fused ATPase/permease subunit